MAVTDLTGYTWVPNDIDSVTVTSSDIGTYAINYSITCSNSEYDSTGGTSLNIVYTSEEYPLQPRDMSIAYITINTSNYKAFGGLFYQVNGRVYESGYDVSLPATLYNTSASSPGYLTSITITSGTDATNSTLISWLEANGTLTAPVQDEPSITIGTLDIDKAYIGSTEISKIYYGDTLLYENTSDSYAGQRF